jgi:DNA repair exonuclease SbcCD ATPase subunit
MILKIEIENFQSHKRTVLELGSGVNIIAGQTDSGKTAILRAIWWVAFNYPPGDSYKSWWGGDTTVTITTDTCVVARIRGDGRNLYLLNGCIADPEVAQAALNIGTINIQEQFDAPFLLSSTPGEVARYINKIVNIDAISAAARRCRNRIDSINGKIKSTQDSMEALSAHLAKFSSLEQLEREVESAEEMAKAEATLKSKIIDLKSLLALRADVVCAIESVTKHLQAPGNKRINATLQLIDKADAVAAKVRELRSVVEMHNRIASDMAKCQNLIKSCAERMPEVCPFCGQRMPKRVGRRRM